MPDRTDEFAQYLRSPDAQEAELWELSALAAAGRHRNVSEATYGKLRVAIAADVDSAYAKEIAEGAATR